MSILTADCVWPWPSDEKPSDDPVVAGLQELGARRQFDQLKAWHAARAKHVDEFAGAEFASLLPDLEALALKDETQRKYRLEFRKFKEWCAALDRHLDGFPLQALPSGPGMVSLYLLTRHTEGSSYASLRVTSAAISDAHYLGGFADPTRDILVKAALRYAKRHPHQFKAVADQQQEEAGDEKVSG